MTYYDTTVQQELPSGLPSTQNPPTRHTPRRYHSSEGMSEGYQPGVQPPAHTPGGYPRPGVWVGGIRGRLTPRPYPRVGPSSGWCPRLSLLQLGLPSAFGGARLAGVAASLPVA